MNREELNNEWNEMIARIEAMTEENNSRIERGNNLLGYKLEKETNRPEARVVV